MVGLGTSGALGVPAARQTGVSRRTLAIVLAVAACFGIYTSFRYHFAAWGLDPDSIQVGLLWLGMRANGLAFLPTYAFGPDNWLFSLVLPSLPIWDLLGPRPMAIVGLGWIAFVTTALTCGVIASILADRVVGLATTAFILLANDRAIGGFGFLSHPASHDISLCWGAATFLLFHRWFARGNRLVLVAAILLLLANCLSDPWAVVAVAVPAFAGALPCFAFRTVRQRAAWCAVGIVVALVLVESRLFGLLWFLPSSPFVLADWTRINSNFIAMGQSLGVIFNIVPGVENPYPVSVAASCFCMTLAVASGSFALFRSFANDAPRLWLAVTVGLSATLPIAAFTLSVLPANLMVGRFAGSLVVFLPVLALSARAIEPRRTSAILRFGVPTFLTLVVVSGGWSGVPLWFSPWRGMANYDVPELLHVLADHHLRYGYGEYWGTRANSITLLGEGRITMRPVVFDPLTGQISRRGGSSLWYRPESVRHASGPFFVAFADDGENCRSTSLCESGVQQQFGRADAEYHDGAITVLAWSKPIVVP